MTAVLTHVLSTSEAEQSLAKGRLVGLLKSKRRVKERLRRAKREEDDTLSRPPTHLRFEESSPRRYQYDSSEFEDYSSGARGAKSGPRSSSIRRSSRSRYDSVHDAYEAGRRNGIRDAWKKDYTDGYGNASGSDSDSDLSIVHYEDIAGRIRQDLQKKADTLDEEAKLKQKAEQEAVEKYRKSLVEDVTSYQKKFEESLSQMIAAFDPPLPVDQVRKFLEQQQAKEMSGEVAKIFEALPVRNSNPNTVKEEATVDDESVISEVSSGRKG